MSEYSGAPRRLSKLEEPYQLPVNTQAGSGTERTASWQTTFLKHAVCRIESVNSSSSAISGVFQVQAPSGHRARTVEQGGSKVWRTHSVNVHHERMSTTPSSAGMVLALGEAILVHATPRHKH